MLSSAEADSPPDSAVIEDSPLLVSKKGILVNTETSQVVQNEGWNEKWPLLEETRWNIVNVNEVAQRPHLKTRLFSW